MAYLKCFEQGLCCLCKVDDYCHYTSDNHISLFEEADIELLKSRVLDDDMWSPEEMAKLHKAINKRETVSNDHIEIIEDDDMDFRTIKAKADVLIITKAQYDDIIKHDIELEEEVERLREENKELKAYKERVMKTEDLKI